MKRVILLTVLLCLISSARGQISTRLCYPDGNTPYEYLDVMVGARISIVVSCDANDVMWGGGLYISEPYRDTGILAGRDYNSLTGIWDGSIFEAAGPNAEVYDYADSGIEGFELFGDWDGMTTAGDWYIIDYDANDVGDCNVDFYDYSIGSSPIYTYEITNVPTRDLDDSNTVDFADFAILTSWWFETACNGPDWCQGSDLDRNGIVDIDDLMLFTDYWLETTN